MEPTGELVLITFSDRLLTLVNIRWYDKTVQLIVSADGASGLCYEHSSSEGIVVISLLEDIIRDLDSRATQPIAYHNCTDPFSFKVNITRVLVLDFIKCKLQCVMTGDKFMLSRV